MIVDAHIHLYPEELSRDTRNWALRNKEPYWLECVLPSSGRSLQDWKSIPELLQDMDSSGIATVVVQSWYWENPDTCQKSISWSQAWLKAHPDRIKCFAPFNAKGQRQAIESLKEALDYGFIGIGELNPPAQGYRYDDPYLDEALELAAARDVPVNFHVTEPAGHDYPGKIDTPFGALIALAQRHPNTKLIFSHLGGLLPFHELNDFTSKALQNVWYDTAATPLLYSPDVYRKVCDTIGSSRVLFGTDYPLRTFPKKQARATFQDHLDRLSKAELNAKEHQDILGKNAISLFNLNLS